MGYTTSGGSRGLGSFTDTPSTVADLDQLATLIAQVGNRRVLTTTDRDALSGAKLYKGLEIYNTTTDTIEIYNGSMFKPWASEWRTWSPSTTIAIGSGGPASASTRYRYENGRIRCSVRWTFGETGGGITGSATCTLPVTRAALAHPFEAAGELGTYYDASVTADFRISVAADSSSTTQIAFYTGLPQVTNNVTATVPVAIGVGDTIHANFTYDPA